MNGKETLSAPSESLVAPFNASEVKPQEFTTVKQLAEESGLPKRTVRSRIAKLVRENPEAVGAAQRDKRGKIYLDPGWREAILADSGWVPKGYWLDLENVEREVPSIMERHGLTELPGASVLIADLGEERFVTAVKRYYPGGITSLRERLGHPRVCVEKGYWNAWTMFLEYKNFIEKHGFSKPPIHKDLRREGNFGLSTAITRHFPGGMEMLKELTRIDLLVEGGEVEIPVLTREEDAGKVFLEGDEVTLYLKEVGRYPLIQKIETEQGLGRQIEAGQRAGKFLEEVDDGLPQELQEMLEEFIANGEKARKWLINCNLRLAVSIAREYKRNPEYKKITEKLSFLDLVQAGNEGLMRAVKDDNWRLGNKFSTYATWWIRQTIWRTILGQGRTIRLPVHIIEELSRTGKAERRLAAQLRREPTEKEIVTELVREDKRLSRKKVAGRIRQLRRVSRRPISLETPFGEAEESELIDFIEEQREPSPHKIAVREKAAQLIEEALDSLSQREALVLRLRFGLEDGDGWTLEQVGERLGITREGVRQIEVKALGKIRLSKKHRGALRPFWE